MDTIYSTEFLEHCIVLRGFLVISFLFKFVPPFFLFTNEYMFLLQCCSQNNVSMATIG